MTGSAAGAAAADASASVRVWTVRELTASLKAILEREFGLLWVEGEVSTLRQPRSGHIYFTLKDEQAQLRAVLFRRDASRLRFALEQGMQVLVLGEVTVYEAAGEYQIIARRVEPRGLGALQAAFEQLKRRLDAEGLFDPARKRPIPFLPRRIGVVTSPTGAAIRDILRVIEQRFPSVYLLVAPVRVQGEGAAAEIAAAIDLLNGQRPPLDVLIVGRGGGSMEDLWAFNEEVVARAVARSGVPVISAVGHEIDTTICDLVADLRAATPSNAAEQVVQRREELAGRLRRLAGHLQQAMRAGMAERRARLATRAATLARQAPEARLRRLQQRVDELDLRLASALRGRLERAARRLDRAAGRLVALGPLAVLERGYSLTVRSATGQVVTDAEQLAPGERVRTRLASGSFESIVDRIEGEERSQSA